MMEEVSYKFNILGNRDRKINKIDMDKAREIRRKYKLTVYTRETLAKEYGVSPSTISKIVANETWKENVI